MVFFHFCRQLLPFLFSFFWFTSPCWSWSTSLFYSLPRLLFLILSTIKLLPYIDYQAPVYAHSLGMGTSECASPLFIFVSYTSHIYASSSNGKSVWTSVHFATYKQCITLHLLAMLCYMDFTSITSSVWALGNNMWRYSRNQIKMN